jgi:hypothetical protein
MKVENFSFFSDKNDFTIDKIKVKKPNYGCNRPYENGFWVAKNNIWYKLVNESDGAMGSFIKRIDYKYNIEVDMSNIYILTETNCKNFFLKYMSNSVSINWNKFIKLNPRCKGIYLTINNLKNFRNKIINKFEKKYQNKDILLNILRVYLPKDFIKLQKKKQKNKNLNLYHGLDSESVYYLETFVNSFYTLNDYKNKEFMDWYLADIVLNNTNNASLSNNANNKILSKNDKIEIFGAFCLAIWLIPSLCIWDKSAVLDVKFVKKMD